MEQRKVITMRAIYTVAIGLTLTVVSVVALAAARGSVAPQPVSFAGTWQLNVNKSTYRPGPGPKSATLSVGYEGIKRHSVLNTIAQDGDTIRTEYVASEDGRDYAIKGSPNADTVALRRTSPGTIERTDKRRGEVVMLLTLRLSQDGKSMTVRQQGVTAAGDMVANTMVYDKR